MEKKQRLARAKRIKTSRRKAGLTRQQVADRTDGLISKHELFHLENGGEYFGERGSEIFRVLGSVLGFSSEPYNSEKRTGKLSQINWRDLFPTFTVRLLLTSPFVIPMIFYVAFICLFVLDLNLVKSLMDSFISFMRGFSFANCWQVFSENTFPLTLFTDASPGEPFPETDIQAILRISIEERWQMDWALISLSCLILLAYLFFHIFYLVFLLGLPILYWLASIFGKKRRKLSSLYAERLVSRWFYKTLLLMKILFCLGLLIYIPLTIDWGNSVPMGLYTPLYPRIILFFMLMFAGGSSIRFLFNLTVEALSFLEKDLLFYMIGNENYQDDFDDKPEPEILRAYKAFKEWGFIMKSINDIKSLHKIMNNHSNNEILNVQGKQIWLFNKREYYRAPYESLGVLKRTGFFGQLYGIEDRGIDCDGIYLLAGSHNQLQLVLRSMPRNDFARATVPRKIQMDQEYIHPILRCFIDEKRY